MQKTLKKYFLIFTLPTLIAFCLAFVIPFILGVYLSFCKFTTVDNATFNGISNYINVFDSTSGFLAALGFTIKFVIVAIISINVLAFALALLLTKKIKGTNVFRTVFFMPNLIGGIVLGYTWQQMLNAILLQYEKTLISSPTYGYWGLILLMNWQMIGYMMIIYIAGLQNVPTDLLEAAKIDGATSIQTLFKVTIPMVMPSITICTFLTLSNSFKLYDQNLALTAGAPGHKTEMVALNIVNSFYGRTGFEGVGQAKALIFFVIVALVGLMQVVFTRKREVEQ
ncbi:MAG: sugar ABC transporter permease [Lachnospiraceae bacterium]|nr:sugar ABC transporter permease [Lachnospiraceae bacterium]